MNTLLLVGLITLAVGGLAYVFIYPLLSGERRAQQRVKEVASSDTGEVRRVRRQAADAIGARRQEVEKSLKQIEERQRQSRMTSLSVRLKQAGLTWSKRTFWIVSAVAGMVGLLGAMFMGMNLVMALVIGLVGGFGFPHFLLRFLKKRRETKFLEEFPNAVDVIVRGVKAGLPVGDCIRIVANETRDPVRGEFRVITEAQVLGVPLHEAVVKLYERMPLPEANFFGIVIAIQQRAGGSLSDALGNLSRVLRDRRKMQAKIKAMSQEAKASAGIIGSLPVVVCTLVYITSPTYIELMWTTSAGRAMMAVGGFWMFTGIMVMRKMINFDF